MSYGVRALTHVVRRACAAAHSVRDCWRGGVEGRREELFCSYLSSGELGDGLGSLGNGVLGKLTWEDEAEGRLNLAGGESLALVVLDQAAGLSGDLVEGVVDEGVHDGHGLLGDGDLWVHLLQDTVDVGVVGLLTLAALAGWATSLGTLADRLCLLSHDCELFFGSQRM